jgi:hypothetical protein
MDHLKEVMDQWEVKDLQEKVDHVEAEDPSKEKMSLHEDHGWDPLVQVPTMVSNTYHNYPQLPLLLGNLNVKNLCTPFDL